MTPVVRELTRDELPAAWEMGRLAFGGSAEPPPTALRAVPGVSRPWHTGAWELTIADGQGALVRTAAEPDLDLHVRGFAALYCGVSTGRAAAQAGLAGGNADPAALDLLASGAPAQLLDWF